MMNLRKQFRLWPVLAALLLVLSFIFAGCGGSEDDSAVQKPKPPKESQAAPAAPAEPTPPPAAGTSSAPSAGTEDEAGAAASYKIEDGSDHDLAKIKKVNDRRWTITLNGSKYALEKTDDYEFKRPDGKKLKAKLKDDKLKLKDGEDTLLEMKFQAEKIKIEPKGGAVYEFKFKDEKIKVVRDDKELGQVKHYPETGKTKAKSETKDETAQTKDFSRLSAALCPFLMGSDVPEEQKAFLVLVLMAMGK
jgi:hypothetical protein